MRSRRRADYPAALLAVQRRLGRGLTALDARPTAAAHARWLRLAWLSLWLIARHAETTHDRGAAWCATDTGRWYAALEWPAFSLAVIETVGQGQRLPGWSHPPPLAAAPPPPPPVPLPDALDWHMLTHWCAQVGDGTTDILSPYMRTVATRCGIPPHAAETPHAFAQRLAAWLHTHREAA